MDLSEARDLVAKKRAERDAAKAAVKAEQATLESALAEVGNSVTAQKAAQHIAQQIQQSATMQIAGIVSRCLEAVFDSPYNFQIIFEQKRGKTEARLVFIRDGNEVDPLTASGGGVVDVAGFALRLAALVLTRPAPRRLLVLDEPFRFVSREFRPRLKALLLTLAEEMGVQFVIVTHIPEIICGNVIEL